VVKAFARETFERERFEERNRHFRDANLEINKVWLRFFPVIEILANVMTLITVFIGGLFIINGNLTAGKLSIFTSLSWALANPMRNLGTLINDLQRFFTCANKVIEVYYSRPLIADREDAVEHEKVEGNVSFRDVCFSFGKVKILDHVSFDIKAGETLAVIGPTGAGKTTLINLLARFYDVDSGEILLDDCDVRKWKLSQLRSSIGTATQDVFLFSDTVEGNIAFGNQSLSEDAVHDFARRAAAHDFVKKMPEGYDTIVGERGVGLSGGQKQRIALARALATEPPVLVLDDTTSAVDMETEKYIQQQLAELPNSCTKIIIAQRISSVKNADQIIVLEHGRIAERGTHEELLRLGGYYWETFALQNDIPADAAPNRTAEAAVPEGGVC
jgi:ATP-binding cassette subfamily B protein